MMECKKCKRVLPDNYKHKYCENCINSMVDNAKNACKAVLALVAVAGLSIITKGLNNDNDNK